LLWKTGLAGIGWDKSAFIVAVKFFALLAPIGKMKPGNASIHRTSGISAASSRFFIFIFCPIIALIGESAQFENGVFN
jgi:hypothetical protein